MKRIIPTPVIVIATVALLFLSACKADAADVQLAWVANPSTDQVQNYSVWQASGAAGAFAKVQTVGTNLNATVSNLVPGVYRFQVTAANAWGVDSAPSSVVSTPPAQPSPVQQVQAWLVIGNGTGGTPVKFNLSTGQ